MKEPVWVSKPIPDEEIIIRFQEALNIDGIPFDRTISTLLLQRNIDNYEKAKVFFKGGLNDLYDPFLMADMDKAVERLSQQIDAGKKILIFGDYDVDGTTSVALIYLFLKNNFPELPVEYYVPDRYTEGYGISSGGIDFAKENGCSLMIAIDCGIKAVEKVDYANSLGVDVIICDHHTPGEKLPDAVAVLDPKRDDCKYPFKELSGCGVGFKLLQAFSETRNIPSENLFSLIDLLALSIASDIVPITDENRILCRAGIEKLTTNPLPGIKAIMEQSGILGKKLEVSDLVFKIGPRINASGRMIHGKQSVKLLIGEELDNLIDEA
ncbi:MAG: DHH family phosphoesterase, partial [Bacteroidales bacterium]|nr:DHH family phosphoesterase [Bacteroidales bacterium]